jgi:hypothetical protein
MIREVEGVCLDLEGLRVSPGLVNAHDHLQFALFPRLGRGPYPNAEAWARDIYHPSQSPIREHLQVPKKLRLLWGGLRNLLAGVTEVSHHDAYHPVFDQDFPVRVVKNYGWAHSFAFGEDVTAAYRSTPSGVPFLIHLAEGTDAGAEREVFRLHEVGALTERTVLVHAVGISEDGWRLVRESGASVISCPRSNFFVLGQTQEPRVRYALGTDSPLTVEGDLIDEIHAAGAAGRPELVTSNARCILHLPPRPEDWIAVRAFGCPPELVVIAGRIHLLSSRLATQLPEPLRQAFSGICIEGRPPVLIRWNAAEWLSETSQFVGDPIRLGGRTVSAYNA